MNRTIKFRGKNKNGKWLYGNLGKSTFYFRDFESKSFVIFDNLQSFNTDNYSFVVKDHSVDEKTIGQFTGLFDKNGKEIFEGDIIERHIVCESLGIQNHCKIYVHWGITGFVFRDITFGRDIDFNLYDCKYSEVIGNIYDNTELLEAIK